MTRLSARPLTPRQRETLDWIKAFIAEHGMPPTVREIGNAFGIKSSTVFAFLRTLQEKGYLRRGDWGARSLIVKGVGRLSKAATASIDVPILGQIPAGQPLEAIEESRGTIAVNRELLRGAVGFALKVEGRSMIDAGIQEGDYVIVRRQEIAKDGDIVVALIENEATLKRFFSEEDGVRLEPANRRMRPLHVRRGEFRIQGKVIALIRMMD